MNLESNSCLMCCCAERGGWDVCMIVDGHVGGGCLVCLWSGVGRCAVSRRPCAFAVWDVARIEFDGEGVVVL